MASLSNRAPNWCSVRWCAVRVGGRNGKIAGYLWHTERGYAFGYLIEYMADCDAREIDPFNLPFSPCVVESPSLMFGPLSVFGMCLLTGRTAEIVETLFAHKMTGGEVKLSRLPKPEDDLTRLVWASHHGAPALGVNGLWFDPIANINPEPYYWFPPMPRDKLDTMQWERARAHAVSKKAPPDHKTLAASHALANSAKMDPAFLPSLESVAALPGQHIKLHVMLESKPGILYIDTNGHGVRPLRLRAAYLDLARRCGLSAVKGEFRSHTGRDYLTTTFYRRAMCPYAPPPPLAKASTTTLPNLDNWMDETTEKGALLGASPWKGYAEVVRALTNRGLAVDRDECFKRLAFAILCGTLNQDTSPILLQYDAEPSWEGDFIREPGIWRLAPVTAMKLWLIPWKTALRIKPRLVVQCARYGRMLGLSNEQIDRNLTRVVTGLREWDECVELYGLNGFERIGARPAITAPPAKSGQAVNINRPVRKPDGITNIPAEIFAQPRRDNPASDDDGSTLDHVGVHDGERKRGR